MTNESDVRTTKHRTEYFLKFNSVIKRVKQCCCTLILLPKSTLNANLATTNRFYTNDDWQRGRFENCESDHRYESNLESDVRFKIESNHEASQAMFKVWWDIQFCCMPSSVVKNFKNRFKVVMNEYEWSRELTSAGIFFTRSITAKSIVIKRTRIHSYRKHC